MMVYHSESEISKLVEAFLNRSLPKQQWTHEAHLTVALWHIHKYDFERATELVRSGIKAYNIAVGTLNTPSSGYHETLTVFWLEVLAYYKKMHPEETLLNLCNNLLRSEYASKELPFKCISKEKLMTPDARICLKRDIFEENWKFLFNQD